MTNGLILNYDSFKFVYKLGVNLNRLVYVKHFNIICSLVAHANLIDFLSMLNFNKIHLDNIDSFF